MVKKAAIFDMDGLLIDSEPLWREAEVEVFGSLGVPMTEEMCRETIGVRLPEVVRHWHAKYPWQGESLDSVEARILEKIGCLIVERSKPMPGVTDTIKLLLDARFELAVASSSPLRLIHTALETFGLVEHFSVVHSAEFESEGKPHPAVYLSAISLLGADPGNCIAFEDSILGVQSAKSAGTWVIAVPDSVDISNPAIEAADVVLSSLTEFSIEHATRRQ